jgi:hypothetical protein
VVNSFSGENGGYRSPFLSDELSAGGLGCGNDLVEAFIPAQIMPARIEAEIAVRRAVRDCCDNFELLERDVPCTRAPNFP